MTSFLVIEEEPDAGALLAAALLRMDGEVRVVRSDEDALSALSERPADVLMVPLEVDRPDDRARLARLRASAPSAAVIALHARDTAQQRALTDELGVAALLGRGQLGAALDAAVERAREASRGFRGSLHGLNLHDVLQMFHLGRRTLSVHLGGRAPGRVDLERGEIVHAVSGDRVGREALASILASPSGSMRTAPRVDDARTIEADFAALMLETAQRVDEAVRDSTSVDPPPDDASDEQAFDSLAMPSLAPAAADVWGVPPPPALTPRPADALCRALIAEIPGALVVLVVAIDAGELVGAEVAMPLERGFEHDLAAYFRALFGGDEARALSLFGEGNALEEAHVATRHGHLLGRTLRGGTHALVVVLPPSGDVAGAHLAMRALTRGVESNL